MGPSVRLFPAEERPSELPIRSAEHLSVTRARDLLDWLEGQGVHATEVQLQADGRMTVRWPG